MLRIAYNVREDSLSETIAHILLLETGEGRKSFSFLKM